MIESRFNMKIKVTEDATALLDKIVEEGRSYFLPEYQSEQTKADCLGIKLAHYFKWDCLSIALMAMSAMEDANDHELVKIIEDKLKERRWI